MTLNMKSIDEKNWLEADPVTHLLSNQIDSSGNLGQMTGEDWLSLILEAKLAVDVPVEIRRLFEVARGTMAYGYFFYPLFTLGCEQLYRVAESAVSVKCERLHAPKGVKRFIDKIEFLEKNGTISSLDVMIWNAFRGLRNESSHPKNQSIFTPGIAIPQIELIAKQISSLFS